MITCSLLLVKINMSYSRSIEGSMKQKQKKHIKSDIKFINYEYTSFVTDLTAAWTIKLHISRRFCTFSIHGPSKASQIFIKTT